MTKKIKPDDIVEQIGQSIDWVSYWRCWLISIINAVATLTNTMLSKDDFRNFVEYAKDLWIENKGGDKRDWDEIVLPRMKKRFGINNIEIREMKLFSVITKANIARGYPHVVSIWSSPIFKQDKVDWRLTASDYLGRGRTWHAIVLNQLSDWLYFLNSTRNKEKILIPWWLEYIRRSRWLLKNTTALLIKYIRDDILPQNSPQV